MSLNNFSEGGVTAESFGEYPSCSFEFVPDESHPKQPCPHRILRILGLLWLGACKLQFLCKFAQRQTQLNVALELSCMEAVEPSIAWYVELKEAEFNGSFFM